MSDAAYMRETRALLKKLHLCYDCKQQDAYTLAGRYRCYDCNQRVNEKLRKRKGEHPEAVRAYAARVRQKQRAAGLCTMCGKRKPLPGRVTCKLCIHKVAVRMREKSPEINRPRGANGFCYKCNKRKAMEGYRLCEACYATNSLVTRPDIRELGKKALMKPHIDVLI